MNTGIITTTGQTALVINFPHTDNIVSAFRKKNDPYSHLMGAHVTLAIPFFHITKITEQGFSDLENIAQSFKKFTVHFNEFGQFPHVLFLKPNKNEVIKEIHKNINNSFPRLKLYGGDKFIYTPHLTIAQNSDKSVLNDLQQNNPQLLSLTEQVSSIDLLIMNNESWEPHTQFSLGT